MSVTFEATNFLLVYSRLFAVCTKRLNKRKGPVPTDRCNNLFYVSRFVARCTVSFFSIDE